MKKGFYFIVTTQEDYDGKPFNAPVLEEGSFEHYGLLMVNRPINYKNKRNRWKVSHINSGACVKADVNLSQARKIVKSLQGFKIWNIKTYDDLTSAINNSVYFDEVQAIKSLCRWTG